MMNSDKENRDDYSIADAEMAETLRNLEYERDDDEDEDYEDEDEEDDGCPLCGRAWCSGWNCL